MKQLVHWILTPPVTGPSNILIIRWMMATVCICEGIFDFFYGTAALFVAIGEILGGLLLVVGLLTRLACLYLIIQTILQVSPVPHNTAVIAVLHDVREQYSELLTCLYLLIQGPGRRSLDFRISTAGKIYRMS
ncbi:MAG TPA: DoxX family membrane protein [Puia sp.]|jgi:putative oxidoreductase|nr:DoxX family membrane protein [Puia sp.]